MSLIENPLTLNTVVGTQLLLNKVLLKLKCSFSVYLMGHQSLPEFCTVPNMHEADVGMVTCYLSQFGLL